MTDMLQGKTNRLDRIKAGCERSFAELQQATNGNFGMDTIAPYVAHVVDLLVTKGVITQEDKVDMEIEFYTMVESKLDEAWGQYRAAVEKAKQPKLAVPRQAKGGPKLIGLDGKPLT